MTWWIITWCELKILVKQKPKLIFSMFVIPLCYLLLFGTLFSKNSVDQIPLVICDESQTYFSSKLTDGFENTERFSVVQYVNSPQEMQHYLYEKNIPIVTTAKINELYKSKISKKFPTNGML